MKKFYQIKSEGKWFAKCPKTDSDPNVKDGREFRHWTFGDKEGQTLGWFKGSLVGLITGAEVKPLGEDMFFCLYLDNGDVAQWKLYESTFLGLANSLSGIDLTRPVRLDAELNPKKTWTNPKSGKSIVPTALYIKQGDERPAQRWEYNADEKWFDGLPRPIVEEKFGRKTKDHAPTYAAFDEELNKFIIRVEEYMGADTSSQAESVEMGDDADMPF